MSHIVIHDDSNGVTQYRQFDELEAAVEHLENLHNGDDDARARLYRLDEVEFEVKSYVRVEIGGTRPEERDEVTHIPASEQEILPAEDDLDDVDDIEYVEAAMGPIETMEATPVPEYASDPADEPVASGQGESRRGLFGR